MQLRGIFQLRAPQLAACADQAVSLGQGFVELGTDVTVFRVGHNHVEVLPQALDHRGGDAAEGEYSLFHRAESRR
ncbi:hypothetical protein D3C80_597920 [compost metagenome]